MGPCKAPPRRASGFTLIELLVVVFIIGILVTVVSLSVSGRSLDARLQRESSRINQVIGLAMDESELKGLPLGLRFTNSGYQFLALDSHGRWVNYASDGEFGPHRYQPPFYTELHVDGRLVPPAQDQVAGSVKHDSQDDPKNKIQPQVLLLPGGESSVFTVDVLSPGYPVYYRIQADALGRVQFTQGQVRQ